MIGRALHLGDPLLAELDTDEDIARCDLPTSRTRSRPAAWWIGSPVLRRPFEHARQLRPSVWVADDLAAIVLPAIEAMATRDPFEQPGADGVMRRWRRCTSDVWARLRAERPESPALAALRDLLARVHGFNPPSIIARLNGQAAA
jgi:hypothetical protein